MAYLELTQVSKGFASGPRRVSVLEDVRLIVGKGEFVAIVGYSGVGRRRCSHLIAGLTAQTPAEITLDGLAVSGPGRERGMVFQNYSLLPWLTVYENVALGVDQVFRAGRQASAGTRAPPPRVVNLSDALDKRPGQLSEGCGNGSSGACLRNGSPKCCCSTSHSARSTPTRANLQDELAALWQRNTKTVVLVTNA